MAYTRPGWLAHVRNPEASCLRMGYRRRGVVLASWSSVRKDRTGWLWGQTTCGKVQLSLEKAVSWRRGSPHTTPRRAAFTRRCRVRQAFQRARRPALRIAGACLYFGTLVVAAKVLWAPLAVLASYGVVLAASRWAAHAQSPCCRVSTSAVASAGASIFISPVCGVLVGAVTLLCPERCLW